MRVQPIQSGKGLNRKRLTSLGEEEILPAFRLQLQLFPGSSSCWFTLWILDLPSLTILGANSLKYIPLSVYIDTYTYFWLFLWWTLIQLVSHINTALRENSQLACKIHSPRAVSTSAAGIVPSCTHRAKCMPPLSCTLYFSRTRELPWTLNSWYGLPSSN